MMGVYWPDIFRGVSPDSFDYNSLFAQQMVGWGNIYMGYEPPCDFYDVMDEASKITGVFTGVECRDKIITIEIERKRNGGGYSSNTGTSDGSIRGHEAAICSV